MITKLEDGVVLKSEAFVEHQFKINASAKAFDILSSGLYSNKIGSIIRELSANSYDAHVAANNLETPFLIHLPNQLEPYFSVRDYGIGLSNDDVLNVYTTYFQSTKTTTNDFVGCLGLGSKSPFSLVDSFTVTSFFNGTKRVYNAYKNEQNLPSIVLMGEGVTTEHNGLEIMFSVKREDFQSFVRETSIVLQYFKLQPKIVGATITPVKIEYFLTRNTWGVRKYTGIGNYGARAVMGNIAYSLSDYPDTNLTPSEKVVARLDIDINFKIGDLDVSASREKLSYDNATKKNVKAKLGEVAQEIITELEKKVAACTTLWDARVMVYSLKKGDYKIFAELITYSKIEWKGQILTDSNRGSADYVTMPDKMDEKIELTHFNPSFRRSTVSLATSVPIVDNIVFFMKDIGKLIVPRCQKLQEDNKATTGTPTNIFLLKEKVAGGLKEFKALLGMDDSTTFVNISTLPYDMATYAAQNNRTYNPKSRTSVLKYNSTPTTSRGRNELSAYWDATEIDLESEGGIYVNIERYKVNGVNRPTDYINKMTKILETIGIDTPVVYGIKEKEQQTVKDSDLWVELVEYVKTEVEDYCKTNSLVDTISFSQALAEYNSNMCYDQRELKEMIINSGTKVFGSDINLTDLFNKIDKFNKNKYSVLIEMLQYNRTLIGYDKVNAILGSDATLVKQNLKMISDGIKYVETTYPMFRLTRNYNTDTESVKILKAYVDMVIEKNKI